MKDYLLDNAIVFQLLENIMTFNKLDAILMNEMKTLIVSTKMCIEEHGTSFTIFSKIFSKLVYPLDSVSNENLQFKACVFKFTWQLFCLATLRYKLSPEESRAILFACISFVAINCKQFFLITGHSLLPNYQPPLVAHWTNCLMELESILKSMFKVTSDELMSGSLKLLQNMLNEMVDSSEFEYESIKICPTLYFYAGSFHPDHMDYIQRNIAHVGKRLDILCFDMLNPKIFVEDNSNPIASLRVLKTPRVSRVGKDTNLSRCLSKSAFVASGSQNVKLF